MLFRRKKQKYEDTTMTQPLLRIDNELKSLDKKIELLDAKVNAMRERPPNPWSRLCCSMCTIS